MLSSIVVPGSRTYTITHDSSEDLTSVTDPAGDLRTFTYDSDHHLTGDSLGSESTAFTYDATTGALIDSNSGLGSTLSITPSTFGGLQTTPVLSTDGSTRPSSTGWATLPNKGSTRLGD